MRLKFFRKMRSWFKPPDGDAPAQPRPATRAERGQALVIVAMAMIGLLAFIGLMVDGGILFIGEGHLRRAADAAALAASAQFRENRTYDQRLAAAGEVAVLNGVAAANVQLFVCVDRNNPNSADPHNDPSLCPKLPTDPQRKLQKIVVRNHVRFAFLTIIGFSGTDIVANATSEAASVDVVLVIDTSDSMSIDSNTPKPNPKNCTPPPNGVAALNSCEPFEEVKTAAESFISRMYVPYDRVALVTFDSLATSVLPLTNTLSQADVISTVANLQVSPSHDDPVKFPACHAYIIGTSNDPSDCTNTSQGGGLHLAYNEFGRQPIRQESVWVVILLTDGAANASEPDPLSSTVHNRYCPVPTWNFNCRGGPGALRNTLVNPSQNGRGAPFNPTTVYSATNPYGLYNAEDFTRDWADRVACSAKLSNASDYCKDSIDYNNNQSGQGALIFSIGLGSQVIADSLAPPNAGDTMLRYISNVGIDGNPDPNAATSPDPCNGIAVPPPSWATDGHDYSYNCGNYYLSKSGAGLTAVFQSIASRVFTRLTQ